MNILVLGGAGYIGSHFVKYAVRNHNVHVIDNLQTGHKAAVHTQAHFHHGDIRDTVFLDQVFEKAEVDVCVHFAANSLVSESMDKPLLYFDNNVHGTINLLKTMEKYNVKHIVFSSSAAVYGNKAKMPLMETDEIKPTNPYGESKRMMEQIMRWTDVSHGIKFISLRYFNVAGAASDHTIGEDHRPESHLIPIVLQVPLGIREKITIFGDDYDTPDGTCVRDYIHVDDLANAHLLAMNQLTDHHQSEIFNLGNNRGYSNLEIVEVARDVTNHPIPMEMGERRRGDPDKLIASNAKAREILGWEPKHDLRSIIKDAWAFHQAYPKGYND